MTQSQFLDKLPYKYRVMARKTLGDFTADDFTGYIKHLLDNSSSFDEANTWFAIGVAGASELLQDFVDTENKLIDKYNEAHALVMERMLRARADSLN
jgi:hypothetical protein